MRYALLVVIVALPAILGPVSLAADAEPILEATETRARVAPLPPGSEAYRDDVSSGALANLSKLFSTKIAPSLAGALLLLVLSVLFSTINFYAELRGPQRSLRRGFRYLLLWIFVNYVFALLFLVLILPEGMNLATVSRTLVMYCLVATALPELSANVRLQLGRSDERTLDLYKYKAKMSDLIARRMERASAQAQSRERGFLEAHYESQPDELVHRVRIFTQHGDLSEAEQAYLRAKLDDPALKGAEAVLDLVGQRPALMRKTLEHFADDIARFRQSPKARLLAEIQLDPTREEVHRLVEAGITSARGFLFHTTFAFQRQRLATATSIPGPRLRALRVSTLDAARRRRRRYARAIASGLVGAAAVLVLLAWHGSRLFPTYEPLSIFTAGEATSTTPADTLRLPEGQR